MQRTKLLSNSLGADSENEIELQDLRPSSFSEADPNGSSSFVSSPYVSHWRQCGPEGDLIGRGGALRAAISRRRSFRLSACIPLSGLGDLGSAEPDCQRTSPRFRGPERIVSWPELLVKPHDCAPAASAPHARRGATFAARGGLSPGPSCPP